MQKKLITVDELAEFMKCSPDTIYRKVRANKIAHVNFGGIIRFDPDQIPGWNDRKTKTQEDGKDN